MRDLTVAASAVRILLELAASRGASRDTLAERSQIGRTDLHDPDNRIPFRKYVALMRAGQELCNDPALALHFGESVDLSEISIVHMVGGAENIVDALAQVNRYARLSIEVEGDETGDRFQLQRIAGRLWLIDLRRNPNDFPELTESSFARMACTTRRLAGERPAFDAVHVTHSAPIYRSEYDRIFRVPVVFGSNRNGLRIDEGLLMNSKFPRVASQYVTGVMRNHADALLQRLESSHSMRYRVERLLIPILHTGDVSMEAIAGQLGISRQKLFRSLRVEGVTFEQVLDELRHKLALDHLSCNKASVKQTARLVGYSEPAAFSRAFKRWTGTSPRTYVSRKMSTA
jgi:AraC-like DNA-binding protein